MVWAVAGSCEMNLAVTISWKDACKQFAELVMSGTVPRVAEFFIKTGD